MKIKRKHKCEQCFYSTNRLSHLKGHILTHKRMKCHKRTFCSKAFIQIQSLKVLLRTHTGKRSFFCSTCLKKFGQLDTLLWHKMSHLNRHYFCPTCWEDIQTKCVFKAHECGLRMNPILMQSERKHNCEECSYSTNRSFDLRKHLLTHTGKKPYKCTHCLKAFIKKQSLQLHLRTHTEERLSCSQCLKTFGQSDALRKHERIHLNPHYFCPTCWEDFQTKDAFKAHECGYRITRIPMQSKWKYRCEECSYSTNRSFDLRKHLLTHTGKKPYKCAHCLKAFIKKQSLQLHRRTHTENRLSCRTCLKTFGQLNALRRHEQTHSKLLFFCPTCWKDFKTERTFKAHDCGHGIKHTPIKSERKHKCEQCSYSTNRSFDLRKHILTHG